MFSEIESFEIELNCLIEYVGLIENRVDMIFDALLNMLINKHIYIISPKKHISERNS